MDRRICVFGASSNRIDEAFLSDAYKTGELIAKRGFGLVFGAGDSGAMGMAARGAASAGGSIIGVIPEKLNRPGIYFEDCTEKIVTPTMHERKSSMERLASGFIALGGGFGTIDEFMEVLVHKQLGYFDKPVVLLNTRGYYSHLIAQLGACIGESFASPDSALLYHVADTPEEAVAYCAEYKGMTLIDKLADWGRS